LNERHYYFPFSDEFVGFGFQTFGPNKVLVKSVPIMSNEIAFAT